MRNLAVITARSGSKGIIDKNIKDFCGKPLLAYSIESAEKSGLFNTIMVSTDSKKYAEIAKKYGASVPFLRSKENSTDKAGSWGVITEVLYHYMKMDERFDTVCLLQPTSPLRSPEDIINGYKVMEENEADAVTAVCEMDHSPTLYMSLPEDNSLKEYRKETGYYQPRQKQLYHRINGALYIRKVEYTREGVNTRSEDEYACIMPKERSVDIDDELDFLIAEYLYNTALRLMES